MLSAKLMSSCSGYSSRLLYGSWLLHRELALHIYQHLVQVLQARRNFLSSEVLQQIDVRMGSSCPTLVNESVNEPAIYGLSDSLLACQVAVKMPAFCH